MNKYEQLIDDLAETKFKIEGFKFTFDSRVLIGDVLDRMYTWKDERGRGMPFRDCEVLVWHWSECGASKSLQEIYKKLELEEIKCSVCVGNSKCRDHQTSTPKAQTLLDYIIELKL